ncbi:hypothetical protein CTU88_21445 [Streptomyces sp. JV178]|nr:hypothetical protein CTU88_21445 [Streptomyces sp. JV178]
MTATDDDVRLPLWLLYDGEHRADTVFRLSPAEAEQLHAELCYALGEGEAPGLPPGTGTLGLTPGERVGRRALRPTPPPWPRSA